MPKKSIVLLPETLNILEQMGLQIKYARLRRKISAEIVASWDKQSNIMCYREGITFSCYGVLCSSFTCIELHG